MKIGQPRMPIVLIVIALAITAQGCLGSKSEFWGSNTLALNKLQDEATGICKATSNFLWFQEPLTGCYHAVYQTGEATAEVTGSFTGRIHDGYEASFYATCRYKLDVDKYQWQGGTLKATTWHPQRSFDTFYEEFQLSDKVTISELYLGSDKWCPLMQSKVYP